MHSYEFTLNIMIKILYKIDLTDALSTFATAKGPNGQDGEVQISGTNQLSLSNSFILLVAFFVNSCH